MESKVCKQCGEPKPLEEYYRATGARDGRRSECKVCNLAAKKARYDADPAKYIAMVQRWRCDNVDRHNAYQRDRRARAEVKRKGRDAYFQRTYGITADDFDRMLEGQGGGCAICGVRPQRLASMHVDHDHGTGAIRGLLCIGCNHGLGSLRDDPRVLRAAADYVERHRSA